MRLFLLSLAALPLGGCVAASLAGDVVEGTAKTGVFVGKTAVKTTGAAASGLADGLTYSEEERRENREEERRERRERR